MKYEGLTLGFVNFIDQYKVEKTDNLIKKILESLDNEIEKKDEKEKVNLNISYTNILGQFNIDQLIIFFERYFIVDEYLFFLKNTENTNEWLRKLKEQKIEWINLQNENDFKVQSLRVKITSYIKKSFESFENYEANSRSIKDKTEFALDSYLLSYDLENRLNKIKTKHPLFLNLIDDQSKFWLTKLEEISNKYHYPNWLDWASENAHNIGFSTHVAKLTHSSIKGGSSIYFDKIDQESEYLTTASLVDRPIDVSQTDNKFAPIGKLLKLEFNEQKLYSKLICSDVTDIETFTDNEDQLRKWQNGFLNCFRDKTPSSHSLAKQIYYPIGNNYHLLGTLASSSLDQLIFDKFKFSEVTVSIRKQKWSKKYHFDEIELSYPNIAILKVTSGDKTSKAHMNVSPLNVERVGSRYLFPSAPPSWKSNLKPPISQTSLFDGEFTHRAWHSTKSLQKYLLAIRMQPSTKQIRDHVKEYADQIIGILFNYVTEIHNLTSQSGWSQSAKKLKESHQLWLDPYRQDDNFQQKRQSGNWQAQVCHDFGNWLNHHLSHDKMSFSKMESDTWAKFLLKRLREFERDLELTQ